MAGKILIIDDDKIMREYLHALLKDYTILEATNAEEGFSKAQAEKPELIISDILLPGVNGFDLCARLKDDAETATIPIILMTAVYKDMSFRMESRKLGADDFIEKPFEKEAFLEKVRRYFPQALETTEPEYHPMPVVEVPVADGDFHIDLPEHEAIPTAAQPPPAPSQGKKTEKPMDDLLDALKKPSAPPPSKPRNSSTKLDESVSRELDDLIRLARKK